MNLISVEKISKSFGIKALFSDLSFGIQQGERTALIARNGTGKTTLLRMLTGKEHQDQGKIVVRNGISIGYLDQDPELDESATILETLFHAEQPTLKVVKAYEEAIDLSESQPGEEAQQKLADAMEAMEHYQAWDFEYKIKEILTHLKIDHLRQTIASLSGGQRKRVALARVLIETPDLLILDEPTNHLDLDMIEWLEEYLTQPNLTVFLVTHDRHFLDTICDTIVELDRGVIYTYNGNYTYFLEKKSERESIEGRELDHLRNRLRRELEWVRRQPKARTTKSKSRVDAFYELKDKAAGPAEDAALRLQSQMNRIGGKILELKAVKKRFGDLPILNDFDYTFKKGERIGIVGSNGAGKSTFLNMLTGSVPPDSGTIEVGGTIVFGYYTQKGLNVKESKRVIDVVREFAEVIPLADGSTLSAAQFLNLFQFPPELQHTPIHKLSGGEKRRLYLLTVLITNPNFLILDEPTNDLDLSTLNVLEEFLLNFQGCLIVVSHDRYFMNKLVDHLFVFEGQGVVRDFNGNYGEYRESLVTPVPKKETAPVVEKKGPSKKTKLSNKEKLEFDALEKALGQLELEKKTISEKLDRGGSDYTELQKLSKRLAEIVKILDEKSTRWLELSELA